MYNFILLIFLMLSAGVIIYLFIGGMPRIGDRVMEEEKKLRNKIETFFKKIAGYFRAEKIDAVLSVVLEKILRKIKLILMRLDNATNSLLKKVKSFEVKKEVKTSLFEEDNKEINE